LFKDLIKSLHVNSSDIGGGAARAAYRIHRSLRDHGYEYGLQSNMRVISKLSDDNSVIESRHSPRLSFADRIDRKFFSRNRSPIGFKSANPTLFSIAWPPTGLGNELDQFHRSGSLNLVHLHWLGDRAISIEEIGRLKIPIVWTLHDQWAFCGAEHYTSSPVGNESESNDLRFVCGYTSKSRLTHESGPDLNRITWLRKKHSWTNPIHIVCPSNWLANCVRSSALMGDWPITVIPYPIDINIWKPLDKRQARHLLHFPQDCPLILFGDLGGMSDPRKGADLLLESLEKLSKQVAGTTMEQLELVVFGQSAALGDFQSRFPIHYTGHLHDDISIRLLYAAADVMVVPSRQDNFPQTASEAHACGTPVVAFRTGGLVDIVSDRSTGALADPFDTSSLASAIKWVLEDTERLRNLGASARIKAETLWNPKHVVSEYANVYRTASQYS